MNWVAGEAQPGRPGETRMSPHVDSNHATGGTPGPSQGPDEVMDLLAQVESQFDRIRSLRRTQDEAVRSLTSRSEELEEAESRLLERENELQDEYAQRDVERCEEVNSYLAALRSASDAVARRGRRLRELETWMKRAQEDRHRLRRRLMGVRQAVRRLLRERDQWKNQHESLVESTEADRETILHQQQRLSIATTKIREFSELLQDQAERLEEGAAAMVEADELRTRVRRLEAELDEARRTPATAEPVPVPAPTTAPAADGPDQEHMLRRRNRLQRCRRLIKAQARRLPQVAQLEAARRRQEQQLMEQQQHLDEVRRVLTASEERMIQKWAASRSVQVTGWIVLLVLLLGAGSWWAADRFDPPSMRTMVTVSAAIPEGRTVEPEALVAWKAWHADLVASEGFPGKLARRYAEQTGVAIDPVLVQRRISELVTSGEADPDSMQFSMIGRDHEGIRDWMDAFAKTLVSESARTARSRPNPILAQIRNRSMEGGRQRLSRKDGPPIEDTRIRTSLLIFFLSIIVCLVVGSIVFTHLSSTNRLIDELDEDFVDDGALLSD